MRPICAQNAARHTTRGYIEVVFEVVGDRAAAKVPGSADGGEALRKAGGRCTISVTVTDTGCGIPSHIMPKLFNRPTSETGLGLGLYLARLQVELLGGNLEVRLPSMGRPFLLWDVPSMHPP